MSLGTTTVRSVVTAQQWWGNNSSLLKDSLKRLWLRLVLHTKCIYFSIQKRLTLFPPLKLGFSLNTERPSWKQTNKPTQSKIFFPSTYSSCCKRLSLEDCSHKTWSLQDLLLTTVPLLTQGRLLTLYTNTENQLIKYMHTYNLYMCA